MKFCFLRFVSSALCPLALSILPGLTKLTGNQELWWAKTDILLAATRTWCATNSRWNFSNFHLWFFIHRWHTARRSIFNYIMWVVKFRIFVKIIHFPLNAIGVFSPKFILYSITTRSANFLFGNDSLCACELQEGWNFFKRCHLKTQMPKIRLNSWWIFDERNNQRGWVQDIFGISSFNFRSRLTKKRGIKIYRGS